MLFEICAIVATLGMVAIAVAAVRAMVHVERATNQFVNVTREIHQWVVQAGDLTREARETLVTVREVVAPLRRVADRFEILGDRTANLSAALLGEVESPIRTIVAAARGMKSFTAHFLEGLSNRFTPGRSATDGRSDHE